LVFARKPAPVQLCWLAYPGTTGLTAMDYRLSDEHLDPPGMFEAFYAETTVWLPDAFWCYQPLEEGPAVGALPALRIGRITFGCLNNFVKVNAGVLGLWAEVLKAVAGSRLMLLSPEGSARQRVVEAFSSCGVAAERVVFVGRQTREKYLATYGEIDIGLDTVPANGHTTSLDALWMGVPVVTLVGSTAIGRGGVSILRNVGLPELIAETAEEYVRVVGGLASNLERLAALREGLRERLRRSPLMDAERFCRGMEAAYRWMWRQWCSEAQ
jgi:predicted O-linked N-acetylglucosamine transferase (SPINDLY family)